MIRPVADVAADKCVSSLEDVDTKTTICLRRRWANVLFVATDVQESFLYKQIQYILYFFVKTQSDLAGLLTSFISYLPNSCVCPNHCLGVRSRFDKAVGFLSSGNCHMAYIKALDIGL